MGWMEDGGVSDESKKKKSEKERLLKIHFNDVVVDNSNLQPFVNRQQQPNK